VFLSVSFLSIGFSGLFYGRRKDAILRGEVGVVQDTTAIAAHDGGHPTSLQYILIALILVVITAIEVAVVYQGLPRAAILLSLGVLAALKFVVVVAYYMHLKFDHRLLTQMFVVGFVLAVVVFALLLTLFRVLT
jgi:cytochrome c oxidase subunit 4